MNNSSSRNAISSGASRVRRGFLVVGNDDIELTPFAPRYRPAPQAGGLKPHQQRDQQRHDEARAGAGDSSCTIGDQTIGWKDGKDPVVYPSPK